MATIQRINIIGSREGSRNRRRLKANQTGKKFRVGVIFFFQAEDGIRDTSVTGVQTCALPILGAAYAKAGTADKAAQAYEKALQANPKLLEAVLALAQLNAGPLKNNAKALQYAKRSEERRVGKECRARWSRLHEKKKG